MTKHPFDLAPGATSMLPGLICGSYSVEAQYAPTAAPANATESPCPASTVSLSNTATRTAEVEDKKRVYVTTPAEFYGNIVITNTGASYQCAVGVLTK